MRPTTLADARKLNLAPSVTTILQEAAKPGLEIWKQGQILDTVLLYFPPISRDEEHLNKWKQIVSGKAKEEGMKAATRGTQIHNYIEKELLYEQVKYKSELDRQIVKDTINFLEDNFNMRCCQPERSFCSPRGFGGKVDLCCYQNKFIIDFKTKKSINKVFFSDDHVMQLAAYQAGLCMSPDYKCYNLFIGTEEPGQLLLKEWTGGEIERGWNMFNCLLKYWSIKNKYEK